MDFDEGYRMRFDEMEKYENEVFELKDKYKNQIDIKLAYEVDYLPEHMDERVFERNVDYFIGSVHFINKWGFDNPEFIGEYKNKDLDQLWSEYFDTIKDLANSGMFDIVGHIDLLKIFNFLPKKDIVELAYPALEAIKKSGMAIEINAAGLRKNINEQYPSTSILQEVKKLGIPITISSDAHAPSQVGQNREKVVNLVKKIGFSEMVYFEDRKMKVIKI
jgi:histidinol-phosphatase (PHP family)